MTTSLPEPNFIIFDADGLPVPAAYGADQLRQYAADETKRLTNTLRTTTEALQVVTAERDALNETTGAKLAAQHKVLEQVLEALQYASQNVVSPAIESKCEDAITAIQEQLK